MFSIFQVAEGLSSRLGGTAVAVSHLSNDLARRGAMVRLSDFNPSSPDDRLVPMDSRIHLAEFLPGWFPRLGYSAPFQSFLDSASPPDLVHLHGLWRLYYKQAADFAQTRKIPFLISAHGMLEPWALDKSGILKKIALFFYQDKILRNTACFHVTSNHERRTLENLGFHRPIAVIPWGVEMRPKSEGNKPLTGLAGMGVPDGKRLALFFSRIHPVKGLDLLLPAWSQVQNEFGDWMLLVAGNGEEEYRLSLLEKTKKLGLEERVVFKGVFPGEEKERLFERSEMLILPSRSENFGYAIAEALARGIPVLTTQNTPWSKIQENGCGWWIELGAEQLVKTLQEALGKSPQELRAMGEKGRVLIETDYSLEASGQAMMDLYGWLLGRNPKPDFVQGS